MSQLLKLIEHIKKPTTTNSEYIVFAECINICPVITGSLGVLDVDFYMKHLCLRQSCHIFV